MTILAPGVVQGLATVGATWQTASHASFSFFYSYAFRKTVGADNAIPASFGGGNVSVGLAEDVVGIGFGKPFRFCATIGTVSRAAARWRRQPPSRLAAFAAHGISRWHPSPPGPRSPAAY